MIYGGLPTTWLGKKKNFQLEYLRKSYLESSNVPFLLCACNLLNVFITPFFLIIGYLYACLVLVQMVHGYIEDS